MDDYLEDGATCLRHWKSNKHTGHTQNANRESRFHDTLFTHIQRARCSKAIPHSHIVFNFCFFDSLSIACSMPNTMHYLTDFAVFIVATFYNISSLFYPYLKCSSQESSRVNISVWALQCRLWPNISGWVGRQPHRPKSSWAWSGLLTTPGCLFYYNCVRSLSGHY